MAALPALALRGRPRPPPAACSTRPSPPLQGALVPRVEQRAQDQLHAAVIDVELVAFDDADFAELVDRATYARTAPGGARRVRDTR